MGQFSSFSRSLKWQLSSLLIAVLGFFGLLMVLLNIFRTEIDHSARIQAEVQNRLLLANIDQSLKQAEMLADAMLAAVASDPDNVDYLASTIPILIKRLGDPRVIAGGGIWPEPHQLQPGQSRYSLFWGQNDVGQLEAVSGYNDPEGAGYRHEEWYVPAKYVQGRDCYWSRSYSDPFTEEPMVTCSKPLRLNQRFWGIITVDMKLDGIDLLVRHTAAKMSGYAFVIDRNQRVISAPEGVSQRTANQQGLLQSEIFESVSRRYSGGLPAFNLLLQVDESVDQTAISRFATKIARDANNISSKEALRVARYLLDNPVMDEAKSVSVEYDPILKAGAQVKLSYLANADWYVALSLPKRVEASASDAVVWLILFGLLVSFTAIVLLGWLILRRSLQY